MERRRQKSSPRTSLRKPATEPRRAISQRARSSLEDTAKLRDVPADLFFGLLQGSEEILSEQGVRPWKVGHPRQHARSPA